LISNRHCALWLRGGKISVEDLDSTNGTLVNKRQVKGEVELLDGDYIEIGPLVFQICARAGTPVNAATPLPPTKLSEAATDDAAADLLLSMEDGKAESMPHHVWHEVPSGDTVLAPPPPRSDTPPTPRSPGDLPFGSSGVAKELLKQYRRRKGR
jgi:predicted component of type VI protein secretion system